MARLGQAPEGNTVVLKMVIWADKQAMNTCCFLLGLCNSRSVLQGLLDNVNDGLEMC